MPATMIKHARLKRLDKKVLASKPKRTWTFKFGGKEYELPFGKATVSESYDEIMAYA